MDDLSLIKKIERVLDEVHQTVVRLEIDHGAKLEALFDGQQMLGDRMDRLEDGQVEIKTDLRDVKRTVGLLHSIASDHETRLQKVECDLKDHIDGHE